MSNIKKVVVAGGGVLGSQIAFQTAYSGFDVTIWLRSEGSIGRCQPKIDKLKTSYLSAIEGMKAAKSAADPAWCQGIAEFGSFDPAVCIEKVNKAYEGLKLELDMAKAVADADLVIESMYPTACPFVRSTETTRAFCEGESFANTVVVSARSASSASPIPSMSLPRRGFSAGSPICLQMKQVTRSESPVRILVVTPWSARERRAAAEESLGGSRNAR